MYYPMRASLVTVPMTLENRPQLVRTVLLAALIPLGALASTNDMEAFEHLQRMNQAAKQLSYEGTFVYVHDGRIESMKILHSSDGKNERERLFHLNGSPREVIRENDVVTCILPDNKSVVINRNQRGKGFFSQLPDDLARLGKYYRVALAGIDRVAARNGRHITLHPRDNLRYGYNLWVDEETSLLLKSELVNEAGEVIEQVMFTELGIVDRIPLQRLQSPIAQHNFKRHEEIRGTQVANSAKLNWQIKNLPSGFETVSHQRQHENDSAGGVMHHLVISDGLASVSVYIEKLADAGQKFLGSSYMGAVNVFGSVVNDYQITVVGEVPRETVRMVADSIEYNK